MSAQSPVAVRIEHIEPFHVMALLARAKELESQGQDIVHMEIGEPDFDSPQPILEAGINALKQGHTHYSPALGLPALRSAIAHHYKKNYGLDVADEQVIVTPGSSGALQLIMHVLINPGEEVLLADPSYPCNRHFIRLVEGLITTINVDEKTDYQLSEKLIADHWSTRTKAVMIATPSNPTGTVLNQHEMRRIARQVAARNAYLIVDEIYHGIEYGEDKLQTAFGINNNIFVVNSFSKYYGMTGWRLGWMLAPKPFVSAIDKLAQNIFLAPSTPAQYAALAAFSDETQDILQHRADEFRLRRDYLLAAITKLGFAVKIKPEGAFYIYANCEKYSNDSFSFCQKILEDIGVAVTPGVDFGQYHANTHLRFAYTTSLERLAIGVKRLKKYLSYIRGI